MMYVPKVAVLFGFGINCDHETAAVFELVGAQAERIHLNKFINKEAELSNYDILAVPGGFSFGDHLGSGRLMGNRMRFSLRDELHKFVEDGKPIIGICNGFQILTESGLLPGALLHNTNNKFICKNVYLKVKNHNTLITNKYNKEAIKIPIAHGEGRFFADANTINELEKNDQIIFQYCNKNGEINNGANPNGSILNIAGICNKEKNVFGMMPHPERAADTLLNNTDGVNLFKSILNFIK